MQILSHFATKDVIYDTIPRLHKQSLHFIRKAYDHIEEKEQRISHANERIKLQPIKSIEEHASGINQMLKLNEKELVTVSDDCSLKFWNAT